VHIRDLTPEQKEERKDHYCGWCHIRGHWRCDHTHWVCRFCYKKVPNHDSHHCPKRPTPAIPRRKKRHVHWPSDDFDSPEARSQGWGGDSSMDPNGWGLPDSNDGDGWATGSNHSWEKA
jgi:hypothetical protein